MMQENDNLKIPSKYIKMSTTELEKKKEKILRKLKKTDDSQKIESGFPVGRKKISFFL